MHCRCPADPPETPWTAQCSGLILSLNPWHAAVVETLGKIALVCFALVSLDERSSSESRAGRGGQDTGEPEGWGGNLAQGHLQRFHSAKPE